MGLDRTELRKGVSRTWPYLLSHHLPSEWYRCYSPAVFGSRVHICARCLGIYPGILLAVVAPVLGAGIEYSAITALFVVLVFPLPALLDWLVTTFTDRRGYNAVRTTTGLVLGYGYGVGLSRLVFAADLRVVLVGIAYGIVAAVLVVVSQAGERNYK